MCALYRQMRIWGSDGSIVFVTTIQFVKSRDHRTKNQGSGARTGLACPTPQKKALELWGCVLFGQHTTNYLFGYLFIS